MIMEAIKFKVGDKVRVKSLEWYNDNKNFEGNVYNEKYTGVFFSEGMSILCGKIVQINQKNGDYSYYINGNSMFWQDYMFEDELVTEEKQEIEQENKNKMETKEINKKRIFTKEQAQDVVRCTKFCLKNENENVNVKKKLLEIGCVWSSSRLQNEKCKYLFVSVNLNITTADSEEIFIKHKYTELKVKDVLNIEIKENDMKNEMTKEQALDYLNDTKIICASIEETTKVQEKLFNLGIVWASSSKLISIDAFLLSIENYKIEFTHDIESWVRSEKKRIEVSQILSIKLKEKFDPKTLQPFQQVLVRNEKGCIWLARFYDFNERELGEGERFVTTSGGIYNKCIPYNEETKHLHGTTAEEPEFYRGYEDF